MTTTNHSGWLDAVRLRVVELGARLLGDGCLVLSCNGAAPDVVFEVTRHDGDLVVTLDGEVMPRWSVLDLIYRNGAPGLWLREIHGVTPDSLRKAA